MNGILGLNVRTLGTSRDSIMAAARQIGGAWMLIQDDPDLVTQAKAAGIRTIYRQSGDETLSTPPDVFVQTRAEKGADYVYLTNELDPTPEVLDWTRRAIDYANGTNVKLCLFNFATGRTAAQWSNSRALAIRGIAGGHAIGLHTYLHNAQDSDVQWLALKHELGGLWIVTEYAFYVDSYHGWRGTLVPSEYGAFFDQTLPFFSRDGMPVLCFSGDRWPSSEQGQASGFGVLDSPDVLREMARVNTVYQWSMPVFPTYPDGTNPAPKVIDVSAGLKLRNAPSLSGILVRVMKYREAVTVYGDPVIMADSYQWQRVIDGVGLVGWAANYVDGKPSWVDPQAVDTPHFSVDIPFYSQNTPTAQKANDCGSSCALMLTAWKYQKVGLLPPSLLTVDDLSRHTSLASKDDGLTLAEVSALLTGFGVANTMVRPLTTDAIAQYIQQGIAPLALVNDRYFRGAGVGHFVVVTAVGERGFWCNDPDHGGKDYYITTPTLDKALSEVTTFAAYPYQGLVAA